MLDVNICLSEAEEQMEMAIMHLEDEFAHIRAGKANIRILDDIRVDSYGSMVALNNVAALSTPDPRTIAIRPWDKNMIKVIEKAIIRRDLVKQSGKVNEESKISIRNSRRNTLDILKKAQKDGLPEDAEKDAEEKLQKLHDKYIKKADELFAEKEKEIMTV